MRAIWDKLKTSATSEKISLTKFRNLFVVEVCAGEIESLKVYKLAKVSADENSSGESWVVEKVFRVLKFLMGKVSKVRGEIFVKI